MYPGELGNKVESAEKTLLINMALIGKFKDIAF